MHDSAFAEPNEGKTDSSTAHLGLRIAPAAEIAGAGDKGVAMRRGSPASPIERMIGGTANIVLSRLPGAPPATLAMQFVIDGVRAPMAG